jgi:hypothetical protein
MLSNEQIDILKKYNIPYKNKSIKEILDFLDEEMLKYLDKDYNPTSKYIELEKLYDSIFDNNRKV